MYACEKWIDAQAQKKIMQSEGVVVAGISVAMCNIISWLQYSGITSIFSCDPLFATNPHVRYFKKTKTVADVEQFDPRQYLFIITAFHENAAEQYCRQLQEAEECGNLLRIPAAREVRLEASGICNLHCMSCQCGNYDSELFSFQGRGFLSPVLCDRILAKLCLDYPDNMGVFYYTFGEPFLNPALPELIRCAGSYGLSVILSSNFSFSRDLTPVVQAAPDVLKISVSGFSQAIYSRHHGGGSIASVHQNMEKLHALLKDVPETAVVVGYHIYTDNDGAELEQTRQLCQQYGFLFAPVRAIYNNPLKRIGISPFTQQDLDFLKTYYLDYQGQFALEEVQKNAHSVCRNLRDKLFIDYDGKVMLCELLHKEMVYKSYLDTSPSEIMAWRSGHPYCAVCRSHGMALV